MSAVLKSMRDFLYPLSLGWLGTRLGDHSTPSSREGISSNNPPIDDTGKTDGESPSVSSRSESTTAGSSEMLLGGAPSDVVPPIDFSNAVGDKKRAESTLRVYKTDWRLFSEWCAEEGLGALPAAPETVARYMIELNQDDSDGRERRAPPTIFRRLAAISLAHQISGLHTPTATVAVREARREIDARTQLRVKRVVRPLLARDIACMIDTMSADDSLWALRDTAVLLIGFAGALNSDEIRRLDTEALAFNENGLVVEAGHSDAMGAYRVGIPRLPGSQYCPVLALERWLADTGATTGAVFRKVLQDQSVAGTQLSNKTINRIVKCRASAAGFDSVNVGASSLRMGYLEQLKRNGLDAGRIAIEARTQVFVSDLALPSSARLLDDSPLHQVLGTIGDSSVSEE